MTVHIVTHDACLDHRGAAGHPERAERLRAVVEALSALDLRAERVWHEAPRATRVQLERCHPGEYVDFIRDLSLSGGGVLDPDTAADEASWEAGQRAAGAAVEGVRRVLEDGGHAFVAVRPPGHHAEASRAMGFCLFGNVAIAAREALASDGVERVLILDWDVHHGNGTQALVETDPAIRFVSLHQWPLYPGTGREDERGVGNVWNLPRPPGLPAQRYVEAVFDAVGEATDGWRPDLVLVSAGFDSMLGDPLGSFTLEPEHLVEMTDRLLEFAVPVVAVLEGGYNLDNLRAGARAVVERLGR